MQRIRRRLLAAMAGFAALAASAQPQKQRRIGFLAFRPRPASWDADLSYGSFVRALRDLGYAEGRNIFIEWRFADSRYDRLGPLAAELAKADVEAVITHTNAAVRALLAAKVSVPIVCTSMSDPLANGFTTSLARPTRNVTGMVIMNLETGVKQLEYLRRLVPKATRIGYLHNPKNPTAARAVKTLQDAGRGIQVDILPLGAATAQELDRVFESLKRQGVGAMAVSQDSFFIGRMAQIVALTHRYRVPAIFAYMDFVRAGGLLSYGESISDPWIQAATYLDKLLKGARPADLPIQERTRLRLAVNRNTASALGLSLPDDVLLRADEVVQ